MFHAVIAFYIVLIIAMFVCIRIISKVNIKHRENIVRLIAVGIFTAVCYVAFVLTPSNLLQVATFLNGLYFVGTDWLALVLIIFVVDYTRIHPPTQLLRRVLIALAAIDSVSLILNTFTHHIFEVNYGAAGWSGYWQIRYTALQPIHLTFVYLMAAYCVVLLLYRVVVAPSIYKSKYAAILIMLAMVVVLNLVCVVWGTKLDYSVLIYGFLAISICYFVLYSSPKRLLERMHSTLMEDSVIGLFVYDDEKQCVGANKAARDLFGQQGDEIYSVAEEYLARWEEQYQGILKTSMGDERKIVRNGETLYIYVNYQQLLDEKGRVLGTGFQFENRTEMVTRYNEEKYKATHDVLTGLLNRSGFEEEAREILSRADEPYCMICSNIKDFKLINELGGTEMGDKLLIAQADLIRKRPYENSISARIYADKFCTLLPKRFYYEEGFKREMTALLEDMLSLPLKTHFYFGIYDIVDVTEPIWTMCDKAMMAIDSIRGNYGQFFCHYKEELFQRIMKEKEIIGEFDRAIEDQEFHIFLQPQITNNGALIGAEALVRWIHPDKGLISPNNFIPVLEKVGLIHKLDIYVWEKAAQKLEEWKREGKHDLSISVNISTQDFYLIDVCDTFRTILGKYDFDVKNLKLEITESALMKDVATVMKTMDELHALGYDIEIDDFGSGYSSLGRLKDIHADILKLDMIFLQETKHVDRSSTILKNVISMSKELGMAVITEGVETEEQVTFLQGAGCDMFQGFYFARPMSVDDFEQVYLVSFNHPG